MSSALPWRLSAHGPCSALRRLWVDATTKLRWKIEPAVNSELSADYGPLLQFCDVPPAGHQPAPASRATQGHRARGFVPPFTPRKPRPKIDDR
jgi:hypothetical protein